MTIHTYYVRFFKHTKRRFQHTCCRCQQLLTLSESLTFSNCQNFKENSCSYTKRETKDSKGGLNTNVLSGVFKSDLYKTNLQNSYI